MAALSKVSSEELRLAKLAGKVPKKPKKPKMSASLAVKGSFIERYNEWAKKVKAQAKEGKKIDQMNKSISGL